MDKKYGRSERRYNEAENGRRGNRRYTDREDGRYAEKQREEQAEEGFETRPRRPKPEKSFKNIDEYLNLQTEVFGEAQHSEGDGYKRYIRDRSVRGQRDQKAGKNYRKSGRRQYERDGREDRSGERYEQKKENSGGRRRSDRRRQERQQDAAGRNAAFSDGNEVRQEFRKEDRERRKEDARQEYLTAAERPENPNRAEGRNAVLEAFRSGRPVDKLYVQQGLHEGVINTIIRSAKKSDTLIHYETKERLDQMSETGHHQGVIAVVASYSYATVDDILQKAKDKGEDPFLFLLDNIEDPHNLGAIIRTANLCGAHGVIIPKHRAVGLTAAVAKASAGAINYTPVAKVSNLGATIDQLKKSGMWFVCADMDGTNMYNLELKGAIGLVIGSEGEGVSRLIREKCDFVASIPMKGDIDSLNASVAAGVLGFEIARQRA